MLTKQESILGKGTQVERVGEPRRTQERVGEPRRTQERVGEPRRTALPRGSQLQV